MRRFEGQTAIVTGASSGLGRALALALAGEGARLSLLGRDETRLADTAASCRALGASVLAITGDVTRREDWTRLVEATLAEHHAIDHLLLNAGQSMWARFDEVTDLEVFRRLIEVNYLGAVAGVHAALPALKRSRGLIVAIASIQGRLPVPLHSGYVASKHALVGFCDTLRMELEDDGVGVLTVLPHWIRGTGLRARALGAGGAPIAASSRKHSRESVAVEEVAARVLGAMHGRRRELVIPRKLAWLLAVRAVKPGWADAIVRRAVRKQDLGPEE